MDEFRNERRRIEVTPLGAPQARHFSGKAVNKHAENVLSAFMGL